MAEYSEKGALEFWSSGGLMHEVMAQQEGWVLMKILICLSNILKSLF